MFADATIQEIFNYGVPTGILLIVFFGIWVTMRWAKTHIVEPVIKAHLDTVETFRKELPEIKEMVKELPKQTKQLESLTISTDLLHKDIQEHREWSTNVVKGICKATD